MSETHRTLQPFPKEEMTLDIYLDDLQENILPFIKKNAKDFNALKVMKQQLEG